MSVSQKFSDNFSMVGIKSMAYFCDSIYLDLVNSECDVYLPVDQSLVYSYPKMFLLFFSLINLELLV